MVARLIGVLVLLLPGWRGVRADFVGPLNLVIVLAVGRVCLPLASVRRFELGISRLFPLRRLGVFLESECLLLSFLFFLGLALP